MVDIVRIRASLVHLEAKMEQARDARYQIESKFTHSPTPGGTYAEPEAVLESLLDDIHQMFAVTLEAAGMHETRNRLLQKWAEFEESGGIGKTKFDREYDYLDSKPLNYLSQLMESLHVIAGDGLQPFDSYELAKLETILRKTPVLLRLRGIVPNDEHEIQDVMHDYLGAFFTEYKHPVHITGIIKDFEPDCGIRNLRTAIEFKYAANKEEVSKALGGIFEDLSGYSGSLDWVNFYSVVYQTEPFESEDRFKSEIARVKSFTWKPILVTGAGSRDKKKLSKTSPRNVSQRKN